MDPVVWIIGSLFWAAVTAILARRKNRTWWAFALMGAALWMWALVFLAFAPFKCPKCRQVISNKEAKAKTCPGCNGRQVIAPA